MDTPKNTAELLKYGGGPASIEMNRGSLFHEFARRATLDLIAKGELRAEVAVALQIAEANPPVSE